MIDEQEPLKPCPFCGGEAKIEQTSKIGYTISCTECRISLHQKVLRFSLEWLRNEMINHWNKRTNT